MTKKTLTKIIDYSLSSIIILFSLIYSISHLNLWSRLMESIKDVGSSALSYGSAFYADEIHKSSVMKIPENFKTILPFEWDEFVVLWKVYWQTVFTKESFMLFISHVGFVFEKFSKYFMPALLIAFSLGLALHFMTHDPFVATYDKKIKKIQLKIEKAKKKTTKKITKILSKGATVATVKKSKVKKTERLNRRLTKKIQKYTKKIQKIEKKKKKLVKVDDVIRSIPFRLGQKIKRKFINPVCFRVKHFFKFFFKKCTFGKIKCGIFFKIFVLIWAYNWNVLTIAIETVAYLLYFCSSDIAALKIYTVIVKLLGDATVLISFFNPLAWTCIAWILIEVIRRNAGKNAVIKRHEKDEEILEEYDGEILLTGRQGKGKSTTGAHMTRLVSEMFRNKYAKPDLLTLSAQFPYFSWRTLEKFLTKNAFVLNRKEVISKFVEKLKFVFYAKLDRRDPNVRYLNKIFHYRFKNYIFDYDYEKYGLTYNNGIRNVDIFETIENYAELYFVYSTETSHIFGIVPVREDFYTEDKGFFKIFKYDYYQKPEESERHSKFCHIANQNSFRLGKTMTPNEPFEDGYEFGIEYTPEKGKERGNQLTNRASKADDDKCNPNNDGYEDEAKMMRHIGNIFFHLDSVNKNKCFLRNHFKKRLNGRRRFSL